MLKKSGREFTSILVILSMLMLMMVFNTSSVLAATYVLQNDGFETGSVSPWTNGVIIDTANKRTGSYCGKVTQAGPSCDQTISGLQPNTTYTFSGYLKVATAGERVTIGVKNYGGTELYYDVTSTSYTAASVTFTTGAINTSALVYMYKASGTGAAYGDDFSLSVNGIQNAGFETGSVSPWTNGVTIDTANKRTGSYCGKVTQAGPSCDQTVTGLQPNTTYTFSGYLKVAAAGERVTIGVKNYGGTELYYDVTSTSYIAASVTFTTGTSNTSALVYMYKASGSGAAYGDDFSLPVPVTTESAPLVQNGGFETGSVSPWTNGVVIDTSNKRTGSYCGKVTQTGPSCDQTVTGLQPNTTYTFSGYLKVAAAGERVCIGVKNYGGTELYYDVTSTSYTAASVTFTTGASNTSAVVYMYKASGSGTAYGDDFSLTTSATGNIVPVGGPGGYIPANLKLNDVFGSNRPEANITSVGQFNPSTPYGSNGTGWDRWMAAYGQSQGNYAQLTMQADHLDLAPTNSSNAGFIVSHWECLPDNNNTYYIEIRCKTGRGGYGNGWTWPALWLFSGNEPDNINNRSEIDFMETYSNLPDCDPAPDGYYYEAFRTTHHPGGLDPHTIQTPDIDITNTYNVYGIQFKYSSGYVYYDVYFNGELKVQSVTGLAWTSSPAAIIIGWNVGNQTPNYIPMSLDYVRAWSK